MQELKDRIALVLQEIFAGNIDDMAKCMGVNRTTIFRYKNGSIKPSRKSLIMLQEQKLVRADWMLNGGPDEIQFEENVPVPKSGLPIFMEPVETISTAAAKTFNVYYLETDSGKMGADRYWLRLSEKKNHLRANDLVLIQSRPPRPVKNSDVGEYFFVLKRKSKLSFDNAKTSDVGEPSTVIVGTALGYQGEFPTPQD